MKNIKIVVKRNNYIVVIADTFRFGKNEVMFEGNTFNQCFDYVKRETGKKKLWLTSSFLFEAYTDREGQSFPWFMEVKA